MDEPVYEVERWTSGDAKETHLFMLKGDARGAAYVLGYNPALFSAQAILAFLEMHGIKPVPEDLDPDE